jgi:hypothetical protein
MRKGEREGCIFCDGEEEGEVEGGGSITTRSFVS